MLHEFRKSRNVVSETRNICAIYHGKVRVVSIRDGFGNCGLSDGARLSRVTFLGERILASAVEDYPLHSIKELFQRHLGLFAVQKHFLKN